MIKNPKLAKKVLKVGLSIVGSIAIGMTMKLEKKIEGKIDEHYADPEPEKTEDED